MTDESTPRWESMRVMLAPGDLLVAREGSAVVIARAEGPAQEAVFDQLLELCAASSRPVTDRSGEELVRQAAALATTAQPGDVPAFGLVTTAAAGLLVMVSGNLRVLVTAEGGGTVELDGSDSLLPVTRVLREAPSRITVAPDPASVEPDQRSNLAGGVVRAGALVLVPALSQGVDDPQTLVDLRPADSPPSVEETPVAEVVEDAEPSFTTFSLTEEPVQELVQEPVQDVSVESRPTEPEAAPAEPGHAKAAPLVRGIVCTRGHFNAPDARFCAHCGISMVHQTHNVVTGERPPLGVLVADDGRRYDLVQDFVIGRDPESSDEVRSGRSAPLFLEDPELSLSRVHARLVLDGWEVRLEDAGSANGTFLAAEGSDDWRQLDTGVATTITPGTRVRVGSRVLTYESHHKA